MMKKKIKLLTKTQEKLSPHHYIKKILKEKKGDTIEGTLNVSETTRSFLLSKAIAFR
jgi:hypothetical protein